MVAYESLKTKEKSGWVIPNSGRGYFFLTKFESQFKRGFIKVFLIRPGCL